MKGFKITALSLKAEDSIMMVYNNTGATRIQRMTKKKMFNIILVSRKPLVLECLFKTYLKSFVQEKHIPLYGAEFCPDCKEEIDYTIEVLKK